MRAEVSGRGIQDVRDHEARPRRARLALLALHRHRQRVGRHRCCPYRIQRCRRRRLTAASPRHRRQLPIRCHTTDTDTDKSRSSQSRSALPSEPTVFRGSIPQLDTIPSNTRPLCYCLIARLINHTWVSTNGYVQSRARSVFGYNY